LAPARGQHPALDRLIDALPTRMEVLATDTEARRLAQDVALAVQAVLLVQSAPAAVSDAFCASRIGGEWGLPRSWTAPGRPDPQSVCSCSPPRLFDPGKRLNRLARER
jgi:hypothetical protein